MKRTILLFSLLTVFLTCIVPQYKKDGTPDMRYKANKESYGSSNSSASSDYSNPSVRTQNGYTRSNGTYVEPHMKTNSNSTNQDNFSTVGNTNPYTGKSGSRAKDYSPEASSYGGGREIHTGSRGGQYYINSHGNKTYVPKR
jgi:hypothetical protein